MTSRILLPVVGSAVLLVLAGCPKDPEPLVPPAPPEIVTFTVSAQNVNAGESVTLAWKVEGAETVRLERLGGGAVDAPIAAEGETTITLTRDEVFVLSATSEGGQDARALRVSVGQLEQLMMIAAIPPEVRAGELVTLVYSAPGATGATLVDDAGGAVTLPGGQTGTVQLVPRFDTTWTLAANGRQAQASVAVSPAILSATVTRDENDLRRVHLGWTAGGAGLVTLHAAGRGELFRGEDRAAVAAGSFTDDLPLSLDDDATQVYTLVVGSGAQQAVRELAVRVGGEVAIDSFVVPELARENGNVILGWKTRGASRVQVWSAGVQLREATSAAEVREGLLQLSSPAVETAYELRAISSSGQVVTAVGTTRPIGPPSLVTFDLDKVSVLEGGEPVVLEWEVTNARKMRIEAGALTGTGPTFNPRHIVHEAVGLAAEKGTLTVYPNEATMAYRLTADNTVGDAIPMESRTVTVGTLTGAKTWPEALPRPSGAPRPTASLTADAFPGAVAYEGFPHVAKNAPGAGFVDIQQTGTRVEYLTNNMDLGNGLYALPEAFTVVVLGVRLSNQTRALVSSNGWMTVTTSTSTAGTGPADNSHGLPSADFSTLSPLAIAPFFDDLIQVPEVTQVYGHVDGLGEDRRLIVQWNDIMKKDSPGSRLTFQAQLYPSGKMVFAYQKLEGLKSFDATVGVQTTGTLANVASFVIPDHPEAGDTYTLFGATAQPAPFEVPFAGYIGRVRMPDGFLEVTVMPPILPTNSLSTTFFSFAITEVNFASGPGVTAGEWLEISNLTSDPHNLRGWSLDFGSGQRHHIDTDLILPPNGQLLLAQTADAGDGLPVDYVYGTAFKMHPLEGEISLRAGRYAYSTLEWILGEHGGPGVSVRYEPKVTATHLVFNTSTTVLGLNCLGMTTYGTKGQLGTPKLPDSGCFPYSHQDAGTGTFVPLRLSPTSNPLTITNARGQGFDVTLPFPVRVGHTVSDQLSILSNGFLTLTPLVCTITATGCFASNGTTPSSTTAPIGEIAPFWEALSGTAAIPRIFWEAFDPDATPGSGDEYVLVSWENMSIFNATVTNTSDLNFQVKLTPGGDLEFQFGTMTANGTAAYVNQASGSSATTWIEEPSGRAAVRVNVNSLTPGIAPLGRHVFTWNP